MLFAAAMGSHSHDWFLYTEDDLMLTPSLLLLLLRENAAVAERALIVLPRRYELNNGKRLLTDKILTDSTYSAFSRGALAYEETRCRASGCLPGDRLEDLLVHHASDRYARINSPPREEGIPPGDLALISAEHFGAAVDCALTHRRGSCSFPVKPREGADVGGSCKQMCHAPTRQQLCDLAMAPTARQRTLRVRAR